MKLSISDICSTRKGLRAATLIFSLGLPMGSLLAQEEDAAPAEQGPEELPLSIYVEVGGEYDNNITIDDTDNNSAQGDTSLRFRARLGLDVYDKNNSSLTARYSFFQSLHEDLTDFDLQIHGFSVRGKTKAGKANLGATYRYDNIRLGGDKFQDVHTIRSDVGLLMAKRTYLTAYYEFRSQRFDDVTLSERAAERHSLSSKMYFLFGKGRNVTAGYTVARHNAQNDSFTYWGHTVDTSLKLPLDSSERPNVFRLRYRYRQKDFSAVTPSIGAVRQDKRHTVRGIFEVPVGKVLEARFEYRYQHSDSNLPAVDFVSHIGRVSINWSF